MYTGLYKNKTQRDCPSRVLKTIGEKDLRMILEKLPKTNGMKFAPIITTPFELEKKLGKLFFYLKQQKKEHLYANI